MRWHEDAEAPTVWEGLAIVWCGSNQKTWGTTVLFPSLWPCWLSFSAQWKLKRRALSLSPAALGSGLLLFKVEEISDGFKFWLFKTEISPHAMSYYCKRQKKLHCQTKLWSLISFREDTGLNLSKGWRRNSLHVFPDSWGLRGLRYTPRK